MATVSSVATNQSFQVIALTEALRTLSKSTGDNMNNTDLAEFYGVTDRAVRKWAPERKHRKRVQALANAEQTIVDLIADISKLAYIYDCQWLHGIEQKRWCWINRTSVTLACHIFVGAGLISSSWTAELHSTDVVEQLQVIKTKLEELVYGVQTIA